MELDELKDIWKESNLLELENEKKHSPNEILELLSSRMRGALSKINNSIWVEIGLTFLIYFYAIIHFGFFQYNQWMVIFMSVAMVATLIHYGIKYKILNQTTSNNLREALIRPIKVLKNYITAYYGLFIFCLVWVDFFSALGFLKEAEKQMLNQTQFWAGVGILVLILTIFNYAFYWFCKRYTQFFYGKYLHELQKCLAELDDLKEDK